MSAPVIWVFMPLVLAGILLFLNNQKWTVYLASSATFLLALAAWLLPIETAIKIGAFSLKIVSSLEILGRHLTLTPADQPLLALIYGSVVFWFAASDSIKVAHRLIPLGMAITALLVASLAVEPFLYAALLIEIAVLLSIPLLSPPNQKPGRGLIRFIIFQTLAMPFILFSGWLLSGIEANPGDLLLVLQASIFLGLGFAFLLAVFPFYSWIPLLTEEAYPYTASFVLWLFPTVTLFFGLGFIDRYTWLRTSIQFPHILLSTGVLMVATGGLLAAFQRHLGRIMGYAIITEIGFSFLALGLGQTAGLELFFLLLFPRVISLGVWALSLSILKELVPSLNFRDIKGFGRLWPLSSAGVVLANLTLAGLPLLAGFPSHQSLWEGLAKQSLSLAFWVLIGNLGLFAGAVRTLTALATAPTGTAWEVRETQPQRIFLALGLLMLFILGLFPQWTMPLLTRLPTIFEHLGK